MKRQKSAEFARNILNIITLMIKNYHNFNDHFDYTGTCRGATHSTCNLKYSTVYLNKFLWFFTMDKIKASKIV